MSAIITVSKLSKRFPIESKNPTVLNLILNSARLFNRRQNFYALKNVNFKVESGDRVAIIGGNGSGKTTLLRILAGIYDKTTGQIKTEGKVASLLKTDTGIEPNLNAIENIYLFGMINGLDKSTIKENLEDIVNFAGIKKFVHTPLGDFSSGMIERLAFSIFRYAKADILLVDEFLSSGDIYFRQKSFEILSGWQKQSRTIMITSHEMEIISKFCNKAILLKEGRLIAYGPTQKIIKQYQNLS